MKTIRLSIEYDGTAYQGWQSQRSGITVQDVLEKTLGSITGEKVRLTGAGRTDAGVHALEQVASLKTSSSLPPAVLKRALNAKLPPDIRILKAAIADDSFHPRYDAVSKTYCYLIGQGETHSAFLHRYTWHIRARLDVPAMRAAAEHLPGEHDFSSFRGAGCASKHPVREIFSLTITQPRKMTFMTMPVRGAFLRVEIQANAFLRHMARNIVGTLVEVGLGKKMPEMMPELLNSRDRRNAGPTAPAEGLFLKKIYY